MDIQELRELSQALTPELLRFLELTHGEAVAMPVKADKLLRAGDAAEMLGVNVNAISRWVREGLLTPVYTPHSNQRKFWLSELKGVVSNEPA